MGYAFSRVSQAALANLINMASTSSVPKTQVPGFPNSMISGLPASLNTDSRWGLPAVPNCPTDGTDACIQLRLDAVGYAVNQLFITANNTAKVANQFRIGLYPFIRFLYSYFPLTSSINGSTTDSSTINYAAANLATLLDTNVNANLGSGGTHIDTALTSMNGVITGVGNGTGGVATDRILFPGRLLNHAIDAFDQDVKRESLPHKVRHAQGTRLVLLHLGRTTAQDNHRCVRIDGANFFQHRQSIHLWHSKIEDGHAWSMLAEEIQPFEAAGRRAHVVPMASQDGLQQIAVHPIIINDKNLDHR